jgi:integrase-like protein
VFVNLEGNPLDESRVRKRFARAMRAPGLSGHRVYDLRHGFATLLLANGAPVTYVAAQLGHANPTTTLQWYAHWLPDNEKTYVDSLDFAAPKRSAARAEGEKTARVESRWLSKVAVKTEAENLDSGKSIDSIGGPLETRTPDPLIKSQLLYQLS